MGVPHENKRQSCAIPEEYIDDVTNKQFILKSGDRTLGNVLRFLISRYPEVKLCAVRLSHPAQKEMILEIQTEVGTEADQILIRGLQDLKEVCRHTFEEYETV